MKIIKNSAFYIVLVSMVGYLLNLLLHRYLTHNLTPAAYGDFCIGLNVLMIVSTFLLLGTEISAMRYIPLLEKENSSMDFIRWNFYFIKKILLFFIIFLIFASLFVLIFRNIEAIHTSFLMLIATPIAAIYALIIVYLRSHNYTFISAFIDNVLRYILLIVTFFFLFGLASIKENDFALVVVYMAVFFILTVFTAILYSQKSGIDLPFSLFFSKELSQFDEHREWEKSSIKYMLSNLIFLLFLYIDKIILDIVHEDEDIIGHYSLVVILIGLFSLISQSSGIFLSPNISKFIKDKVNFPALQSLIYKANKSVFILFTLLFLIFIFFGKAILAHFGENGGYVVIYYGLIALAFSQILLEIGNLSMRFLLYGGYENYINKTLFILLCILFVSGVILTYYFGIYGIIGAHIATSFLYMLAFAVKAKKEFGGLKILSIY